MSRKVLVLNILDEEVSSFILKLQKIFNQKPSSSIPHVTIRGPYKESAIISENVQKKLNDFMNNSNLEISDVGMFENDTVYIVYFKVFAKNIEKISRKIDYPKSKYGVNPHITIYKGTSKKYAKAIYSFLKKQNIKINCDQVGLGWCSINKKYPLLPMGCLPNLSSDRFNTYIKNAKKFASNNQT